jgi:xanthine dehydrogenase molybdenum-binding subunit
VSEYHSIGKRIPKPDGVAKVTGQAIYGHDLRIPGMLSGAIKYSQYAHARVLNIDTSRAKNLRGVKAVVTGADNPPTLFGYGHDNTPLKAEKVRWLGDGVAAVAAIDKDTAQEALALIEVEYEPLPTVFDPRQALAGDAPLIHENRESNLFQRFDVHHGDAERALDEADVVVEDTFELGYATSVALEPSFALASWDTRGNLTLYSTTQVPFLLQRDLAEALGIPGRKIKVIQPAIGGAFGRGLDIYPFEPIAAMLARASGKPVRLAYDRQEEFLAAPVRQPIQIKMISGAKRDGTLWVRYCESLMDIGAYVSWGAVTPLVMIETAGSLYRVPHARFIANLVYSNNPVTGAVRGFGNPQSTFYVESSMEHLAEELGIDPLEFRLQNANRPDEETPQGLRITSCGLRECLTGAAEKIGWENRSQGHSNGNGALRRGIGIASTLNVGGGARIYRSDGCGATVKVDDFGRVALITGATEIGQGSDAALTQIVAEVLGVAAEDVQLMNDDSDLKPWDVGVHASRTTFIAGKAAQMAALKARGMIFETAAKLLKAEPADLVIVDRTISVKDDPQRSISLEKAVRARHFQDGGEVINAQVFYDPPNEMVDKDTYRGNISAAYGFGAHAAEVEVDTETGQVRVLHIAAAHDVGFAINPMYVEGQIEGGIHMGLGYALYESLQVVDGRVLNPNLVDYKLATTLDMPHIDVIIVETHDPEGPFGAKGVGEMGVNPVAAAIANAVNNAIGARITSLPITPEKVLRALRQREQVLSGEIV